MIPSDDGREIYRIDSAGRHLQTLHGSTGAVLLSVDYDQAGRVLSLTNAAGTQTTVERNANGSPVAIVGPYGHRTELELDTEGYLARVLEPSHAEIQFAYDTNGLLTHKESAKNQVHSYAYDELGHLTLDQGPAGTSTSLQRIVEPFASEVVATTALGREVRYRVAREVVAGVWSGTRRRTLTRDGDVQFVAKQLADGSDVVTFPDGSKIEVVIGPDGERPPRFGMMAPIVRTTQMTLPSGLERWVSTKQEFQLDDIFNPLSLTSRVVTTCINGSFEDDCAMGRQYVRMETVDDREMRVRSPLGRELLFRSDGVGRPEYYQLPGLSAVELGYDPQGRLSTRHTVDTGSTVTFHYGNDGALSAISYGGDEVASYQRDSNRRLTVVTRADGEQVLFSYDDHANLTSLTPPGQSAHMLDYSPLDSLASYQPPATADSGQIDLGYNADRRLISMTRADGGSIQLVYDPHGRLTDVVVDDTAHYSRQLQAGTGKLIGLGAPEVNIAYGYDGPLVTSTAYSGAVSGTIAWTYNSYFELSSEDAGGYLTNITYDDDGAVQSIGDLQIQRDQSSGLPTQETIGLLRCSTSRDNLGRLTAKRLWYENGAPQELFAVDVNSRNGLGRIVDRTERDHGVETSYTYGYDAISQLVEVHIASSPVFHYGYDPNGNRVAMEEVGLLSIQATFDAQDRIVTHGDTSYQHTAAGDLYSATRGGETTFFEYDAIGNLLSVGLADGRSVGYTVDGRGRRVVKQVDGVTTRGWLYRSRLQPVVEFDGSGAIASRFVYAQRSNVPSYMETPAGTYYLMLDQIGSVRLVVNVDTGEVAQRLEYSPFGRVLVDSNPGFQPFGFAGGLYDPDTGLVRFGHRDYCPEIGRWTTKDPLLFAGGQPNLYLYVGNDPVAKKDPTGLAEGLYGDGIGTEFLDYAANSDNMELKKSALEAHGHLSHLNNLLNDRGSSDEDNTHIRDILNDLHDNDPNDLDVMEEAQRYGADDIVEGRVNDLADMNRALLGLTDDDGVDCP